MPLRICLVILLACGTFFAEGPVPAGTPPVHLCGGSAKPDDIVVCYVAFKGDPAFTSLTMTFDLKSAQERDDRGLPAIFFLTESDKVCSGVYEVSGTLGNVSRGRYRVSQIRAAAGRNSYRSYMNAYTFSSTISLQVGMEDVSGSNDEPANPTESSASESPDVQPEVSVPYPALRIPDLSGNPFRNTPRADESPGTGNKEADMQRPSNERQEPDKPAPSLDSASGPAEQLQSQPKELVEIGPRPAGPDSNLFPDLVGIHGRTRRRPCEGGHKPGDTVVCYVTFAGDSAFTSLMSSFYMRQVSFEQYGLCNSFWFDETRKVSRHWYRLTGTLPACASGEYILSSLQARTLTGDKNYRDGWDYKNQFPVIRLDNDEQTVFPEITYVGPAPLCDPGSPDRK